MIYYNNKTDLKDVYLGGIEVSEVYIGNNKVWPSGATPQYYWVTYNKTTPSWTKEEFLYPIYGIRFNASDFLSAADHYFIEIYNTLAIIDTYIRLEEDAQSRTVVAIDYYENIIRTWSSGETVEINFLDIEDYPTPTILDLSTANITLSEIIYQLLEKR